MADHHTATPHTHAERGAAAMHATDDYLSEPALEPLYFSNNLRPQRYPDSGLLQFPGGSLMATNATSATSHNMTTYYILHMCVAGVPSGRPLCSCGL